MTQAEARGARNKRRERRADARAEASAETPGTRRSAARAAGAACGVGWGGAQDSQLGKRRERRGQRAADHVAVQRPAKPGAQGHRQPPERTAGGAHAVGSKQRGGAAHSCTRLESAESEAGTVPPIVLPPKSLRGKSPAPRPSPPKARPAHRRHRAHAAATGYCRAAIHSSPAALAMNPARHQQTGKHNPRKGC
jgi:hypothetical protein